MSKKPRKHPGKRKSKKASTRGKRNPSRSSKLPFVIIVVCLIGFGGYFFYNKYIQAKAPIIQSGNPDEIQKKIKSLKGNERRMTLMPALFTGKVAWAYQIARQNRDLLDVIYCYCYCAKNIGHKSLLSCYADRHAANCNICMDEAIYASKFHKKGFDMVQVREAVDKKFWRPFR